MLVAPERFQLKSNVLIHEDLISMITWVLHEPPVRMMKKVCFG